MTLTKSESRRADPVLILLKNINTLLTSAKPKRTAKYTPVIKQLLSALSGTDFDLIRSAEYYSDLKETLWKIFNQVPDHETKLPDQPLGDGIMRHAICGGNTKDGRPTMWTHFHVKRSTSLDEENVTY